MREYLNIILPLLAAGCVIGGGITLYFTYPLMAMKPAETGPVPDAGLPVTALRSGKGALYFVDTGEGVLLIDTGTNADKVRDSMAATGIDPADVKWVLLTHTDYDHVAALPLFENAEICMGEAELGLVRAGKKKLPGGISPDAVRPLKDGEALLFGGVRVKCVAAPGHTAGSTVYLLNDRFLFTGDALRYNNGRMSVHPYTKDKALAKASIEKIKGLADGVVLLTSHYGVHPGS